MNAAKHTHADHARRVAFWYRRLAQLEGDLISCAASAWSRAVVFAAMPLDSQLGISQEQNR